MPQLWESRIRNKTRKSSRMDARGIPPLCSKYTICCSDGRWGGGYPIQSWTGKEGTPSLFRQGSTLSSPPWGVPKSQMRYSHPGLEGVLPLPLPARDYGMGYPPERTWDQLKYYGMEILWDGYGYPPVERQTLVKTVLFPPFGWGRGKNYCKTTSYPLKKTSIFQNPLQISISSFIVDFLREGHYLDWDSVVFVIVIYRCIWLRWEMSAFHRSM